MFKLDVMGAVQITGSHNPPEFNGFKMSMSKKAVYGEAIQTIRKFIEKEDFEIGEGSEARYNLLREYGDMIVSAVPSQVLRQVLNQFPDNWKKPVISVSKGI